MKLIHLLEFSMSPKSLEAQSKNLQNNALVGFEFEFAVPSGNNLYSYGAADTISVADIGSLVELDKYFYLVRSDEKKIVQRFESEAEDRAEMYSRKYWGEFYDQTNEEDEEDMREEQAKKLAYDKHLQDELDDFDIDQYIRDNAEDIVFDLKLEPNFGWVDTRKTEVFVGELSDEVSTDETLQKVRDSLAKIFIDVDVNGYATDIWQVTTDDSINDDDEIVIGVEVVSPPLPVQQGIVALKQMFEWMKKNKVITNKSTGLHINVSVKNIKNIDRVKLALMLGEKYVSEQFKRTMNTYAASQVDRLKKAAREDHTIEPTAKNIQDIIEYLKIHLAEQKYFAFNLGKLEQGYVEFRIAGNEDYHHDFEKAKNTTLRFANVLAIACDPNAYKNEYYKKIVKLFHNSLKAIGWKERPQSENPLYDWKYIKQKSHLMWFRTAIRAFQESAPHNKQSTLSILKGLIVDLFEYQKELTAEDVKFIYSLMRIAKISKSELANTIMNGIS